MDHPQGSRMATGGALEPPRFCWHKIWVVWGIFGEKVDFGHLGPWYPLIPPPPFFWVYPHEFGLKMGAGGDLGASKAAQSVSRDSGFKMRCRGALRSVWIIL